MKVFDRKDMAALCEWRLEEFMSHPPKNVAEAYRYAVRTTSGTTGAPMVTVFRFHPDSSKWFEGPSILVAIGMMVARIAIVATARALPRPVHLLALSAGDVTPDVLPLLRQFAPECLTGSPAFALRVGDVIDDKTAGGVTLVSLRGEYLSGPLEDAFARRYPRARIETSYISSETGLIGSSACGSPRSRYHVVKDARVEILDPGPDGAGQVVVSKDDGGFKIERYRIGDIGRILPEPCPHCGAPVLEILGRDGKDYIKCAGAVARREEFDRVAAKLAGFFDDYRAEVGEFLKDGAVKGRIVLQVYRAGPTPTPALEAELAERISRELFLTPTQTLADLVAKGVFVPLELAYAAEPFAQKNKDIKLYAVL